MNVCPASHKHAATTTCFKNHRCRCDPCWTTFNNKDRQLQRNRRRAKAYGTYQSELPATGTHRRIQGLQVIGWTLDHIGEEIGVTGEGVRQILGRKHVAPATAERIATAARHLIAKGRGPSEISTRRALARGWVSILVWDDDLDDPNATPADVAVTGDLVDEVRVWNAVNGPPRRHRLTSTERTEAIRLLHGKRWTAERIAEQIGCTPRTVERVRARLGLVTVPFTELIKRGEAA